MSRLLCLPLLAALVVASSAWADIDAAREAHGRGDLDVALTLYDFVIASKADPTDKATAHNNACVILMNRGHYESARDNCEAAREIRSQTGDERRLARTLNNLGITYEHLGLYESAADTYAGALDINTRLGDDAAIATNYANLGALATRTGRFEQAFQSHARSLEIAMANSGQPWAPTQASLAHINRGVVFERLGLYREALSEYKRVLDDDSSTDPWQQAALLVNAGVAYRNLGDPVRALAFYRRAIEAYKNLEDYGGLSNAHLNIALVQSLDFENADAAETEFVQAIELAERSGDKAELIEDLFYFGQFLLDEERDVEAGAAFERALTLAEESGSNEGQWSALTGLGRLAARQGDTEKAFEYSARALEILERVQASLSSRRLRAGFFGDKRAVYELAVNAILGGNRDRVEPAFDIVQRAKSRELTEAIGVGSGAQPVATIQAALSADALLEYYVAGGTLHLWLLNKSEIQHFDLGEFSPIANAVRRAHMGLAEGSGPSHEDLDQLADMLLPPDISLSEARIRIGTDGVLGLLPFELLLDEGVPVSYLASASQLPSLARRESFGALTLAAFAEIDFDMRGNTAYPASFRPAELPSTGPEIDAISRHVTGAKEMYRDALATESNFRRVGKSGARIIHIATHAVASDEEGEGSALVLTATGDDDGLIYPSEIAEIPINAGLAVLSACRTAPGRSGGLSAFTSLTGAFLSAGTNAVLATLWDVDDAATAAFMEQFYFFLGKGMRPDNALARAKGAFRADPEWSDPSLWSGYVLVGESDAVIAPRHFRWPAFLALFLGLALVAWSYRFFRRQA